MKTAEEFLKKLVYITLDGDEITERNPEDEEDEDYENEFRDGDVHDTIYKVTEAMKAFAEYHVTEAKKEIIKKATVTMRRNGWSTDYFIDEDSVLDTYPLTNII